MFSIRRAPPLIRSLEQTFYWSQSRLHFSQNRPDLASRYARQALKTLEVTEHTLFTAKALVLLAQIENERGNAVEAIELFDQALPAIASAGNAYEHGLLLLEKAPRAQHARRTRGSVGNGARGDRAFRRLVADECWSRLRARGGGRQSSARR